MDATRRLPHIYQEGRWLFLTWHLHGAIRPAEFQPPGKILSGEAFVLMDRKLDNARTGPMFFLKEEIASQIIASLWHGMRPATTNWPLSSSWRTTFMCSCCRKYLRINC